MTRDEFLLNYWNYYRVLEEDFLSITRYIEICEENNQTRSNEIIKQIQAIGSEFDNICKEICGFNLSDRKNIKDYSDWIFKNIDNVRETIITVKNTRNTILQPFENWDENKPSSLFWWEAYNQIKHNRIDNFKKGNFKNLINSLAALYFMEMFLAKKIGDNTGEKDVPNSASKLFEIKSWQTKSKVVGEGMYLASKNTLDENGIELLRKLIQELQGIKK